MPRSGAATRERIIDSAEALVYAHGFSATSIDRVIEGAGITKGALFYHFKTKADLGRALIQRYAERDLAHFDRTMERAEKLSTDPQQQVLIFVGLLREEIESLRNPIQGCLLTSCLYERAEYPSDVADVAAGSLTAWRDKLAEKLREALAHQTSNPNVNPVLLADTLLALIEGGYVLSKARGHSGVMVDLLGHYRSTLEALFGIGRITDSPAEPGP